MGAVQSHPSAHLDREEKRIGMCKSSEKTQKTVKKIAKTRKTRPNYPLGFVSRPPLCTTAPIQTIFPNIIFKKKGGSKKNIKNSDFYYFFGVVRWKVFLMFRLLGASVS